MNTNKYHELTDHIIKAVFVGNFQPEIRFSALKSAFANFVEQNPQVLFPIAPHTQARSSMKVRRKEHSRRRICKDHCPFPSQILRGSKSP